MNNELNLCPVLSPLCEQKVERLIYLSQIWFYKIGNNLTLSLTLADHSSTNRGSLLRGVLLRIPFYSKAEQPHRQIRKKDPDSRQQVHFYLKSLLIDPQAFLTEHSGLRQYGLLQIPFQDVRQ